MFQLNVVYSQIIKHIQHSFIRDDQTLSKSVTSMGASLSKLHVCSVFSLKMLMLIMLPAAPKLLEMVVCSQTMEFLESNKYI